jgi:hypothetical protein
MPCYVGDYDKVLREVFIKTPLETSDQIIKLYPKAKFLIDCNGKVTIKIAESSLSNFAELVEFEINKLQWIPAFYEGNPISTEMTFPVSIVDNRLRIPKYYAEVKGTIHKAKIFDEDTNAPIEDARVKTKYNNHSTLSNIKGDASFYCEPGVSIEVSHINYNPVVFSALETTYSYKIKLKKAFYALEDLNLVKYNPEKMPKKDIQCSFQDWNDVNKNKIIIFESSDFYTSEMAHFNNGFDCFYNYMSNNFILPNEAIINNYRDTLLVRFIISEEGIPNIVHMSKELKYKVDKVIEELFAEMPKWKPANQAKTPVEQEFEIKIILGVNDYWKKQIQAVRNL